MRKWLLEAGSSPDHLPLVFQYNKRDLPQATAVDLLRATLNPTGKPDLEAVASKGIGVFDTLKAIAKPILIDFKSKA
jgi:hypothetical protein